MLFCPATSRCARVSADCMGLTICPANKRCSSGRSTGGHTAAWRLATSFRLHSTRLLSLHDQEQHKLTRAQTARLLRGRPGAEPVANIELFFDLVYVFAITQLSHQLAWL